MTLLGRKNVVEHRFKKYIHNDTWSVYLDFESESTFIELEYKEWIHRLSFDIMQLLARSKEDGLVITGNYILCPCANKDGELKCSVAYGLTTEGYVLFYVFDYKKESTMETAAIAAYNAYAKSVGGKTFDDKPMLHWEALPERIREAWTAAAASARIVILPIEID